MIKITIKGDEALFLSLRGIGEKLKKDVILRMSQIAYDEVQAGAGRHFDTGALFQSTFNRKTLNGRSVGHDSNRAPHAMYVIFGTRPHVIRPKDKKALRWAVPGGFAFAKEVNHPGYRGDDYFTKARDEAIDGIGAVVATTLRNNI